MVEYHCYININTHMRYDTYIERSIVMMLLIVTIYLKMIYSLCCASLCLSLSTSVYRLNVCAGLIVRA